MSERESTAEFRQLPWGLGGEQGEAVKDVQGA